MSEQDGNPQNDGNPFTGIIYASIIGVIFWASVASVVKQCSCDKEQPTAEVERKEASTAKSEAGPKDAAKSGGVSGKEMNPDYLRYVRGTMNRRPARVPEPMKPRSATPDPAKMRIW